MRGLGDELRVDARVDVEFQQPGNHLPIREAAHHQAAGSGDRNGAVESVATRYVEAQRSERAVVVTVRLFAVSKEDASESVAGEPARVLRLGQRETLDALHSLRIHREDGGAQPVAEAEVAAEPSGALVEKKEG